LALEEDYQSYRKWLSERSVKQKSEIYSYVLMTNHVHLLLSASKTENISKLSQSLGRCYVPYLKWGENNKQRLSAYRDLFKLVLDENLIKEIGSSLQTGTPLGSQKFKDEIEELLGLKVGYTRQGRPKKTEPLGFDEKTQLKLF